MERNSERFLTAFNRIEKALRQEMYNGRGIGFSKAVKILAKQNANVRRYSEDLIEYAELRNAIVHNKIDTSHAIAEPHDTVVTRIEKIEKALTQPKKVIPLFKRKVISFQNTERLKKVLATIHEKGFSKFPVYEEKQFKGVVTESGITKWLAEGNFPIENEPTIRDILPYQKQDNYKFIHKNATVYEAVDLFKEEIGKGKRIDALLISENGTENEPLLGIITAWDIMQVGE